jgi:hypothetical protein
MDEFRFVGVLERCCRITRSLFERNASMAQGIGAAKCH